MKTVETYDELVRFFENDRGFLRCHFLPSRQAEAEIKEKTKATVRLIPFDQPGTPGKCMYTGAPTPTEVVFGIAY